MARRNFVDKLIPRDNIKDDLKFISWSYNAYISNKGDVYIEYFPDMFYKKKQSIVFGYCYCSIQKKDKKFITKRVHRIVAEYFVPNPNNYKVVGHKDNIKNHNDSTNLYWTTTSENIKKAYNDNLLKNKKGYEDEQSIPICQFDINGNFIRSFGSISEASKFTKMTKTGISQQCNHKIKTIPRKGFYYRFEKEYKEKGFVL